MSSATPLLTTKLYLPPARRTLVPRPRLTARLSEGLTRSLTLIAAPAGYGKTTLVSEWRASEAGRDFPLAWLSLDEGDNDPARFLTYLIAALAVLRPGFGEVTRGLLSLPQPPPAQAILTGLVNELSEIAGPCALVLDDYHVIAARPVHDALAFLLEHLPPPMRLVVLTRADPPLPLARLRARDQLTEIRAADLRFTVEEAAAFLNRTMGLALTPEQVAALEQRTEGWIAGLQLAALSAQGRSDLGEFVAAFAGSHRYIVDYLAEEVLNRQPEPIRDFLLRTSILERLCGEADEAGRLLRRLLHNAEMNGRMGSAIELLALQALAFHAQGDGAQAQASLRRALTLAEPEGYVRTFVDCGPALIPLLHKAGQQGVTPTYVARLLAAFGESTVPPLPQSAIRNPQSSSNRSAPGNWKCCASWPRANPTRRSATRCSWQWAR